MCGLGVPVGCRMKHAKGMFKRWLLRAGKRPWKAKKEKFHTCGGPRRRPCLGQGRGRRIIIIIVIIIIVIIITIIVIIYNNVNNNDNNNNIIIYIYIYIYIYTYTLYI